MFILTNFRFVYFTDHLEMEMKIGFPPHLGGGQLVGGGQLDRDRLREDRAKEHPGHLDVVDAGGGE